MTAAVLPLARPCRVMALDVSSETAVIVCACGWRYAAITATRARGYYLAHVRGDYVPPPGVRRHPAQAAT